MLLAIIPVAVYMVGLQQQTESSASPATTLSFTPASTQTNPIVKNVNDAIALPISIDPGTNNVQSVKLDIRYDATKLATGTAGFTPNNDVFATVIDGPHYLPGQIIVALASPDITSAVTAVSNVGTLNLKAIASTTGTEELVTWGSPQAFSTAAGDENQSSVLASAPLGAFFTINSSSSATPTVTPVGGTNNTPPVCTSLILDRSETGTAPYSITFTANGTDSNGTISKATFDFGDGPLVDVTQGGRLGTNSVAVPLAHTYTTAGTFTATATLTDNAGGVSTTTTCTQVVTVSASSITPTLTPLPTEVAVVLPTAVIEQPPVAIPTIAATGPEDNFVPLGAGFGLLTLIGAILFFSL